MVISQSKPTFSNEEITAIAEVIKKGRISEGIYTEEFESYLAKYIGCNYATVVNSGTSALISTLIALEIGLNDEVIVPAYTCASVYFAVKSIGAKPVMVDINLDTYSIDEELIEDLITSKTKAIILVHNFGIPARMEKILKLGIPLIEDCAHSIGGSYKNKKLGSYGIASIFSFFATKMITTGEGGAILTNLDKIKTLVTETKTADSISKRTSKRFNFKFTDIQAAMGKSQLGKIDSFVKKRRIIAKQYDCAFQEVIDSGLISRDFKSDTFYRYIIKMSSKKKADDMIDDINKFGICCDRPIQTAPYLLSDTKNKFENSKIANECLVSIPIYPSLTEVDIEKIIYECKDIMKRLI
jgi:perosamine synthetase